MACEHSPSVHHLLDGTEPGYEGPDGGSGCGQCQCPNSRAIALGAHCGEPVGPFIANRPPLGFDSEQRPATVAADPGTPTSTHGKPSAPLYDARMRLKELQAAQKGLKDHLKGKRRQLVDLQHEIEAGDVELRQLETRTWRHKEDNNL